MFIVKVNLSQKSVNLKAKSISHDLKISSYSKYKRNVTNTGEKCSICNLFSTVADKRLHSFVVQTSIYKEKYFGNKMP